MGPVEVNDKRGNLEATMNEMLGCNVKMIGV